MPGTAIKKLLTTEDLLAMPDDGVERWLIRGQLREKRSEIIGGQHMTVRNRTHSKTTARVSTLLNNWRDRQPLPRGEVLDGEAGVRLSSDPDSTVGIDVVYISAETAARQTDETTLVEGIPVLAVEVLSPNDTTEQIHEKVRTYLVFGVAAVWVIDPYDQTIKVYRRGVPPQLFNSDQEFTGDPYLPGFRVPVTGFFD
jgi:Uma2 family endonuclease